MSGPFFATKVILAYLPIENKDFLALSQNSYSKFISTQDLICRIVPATEVTMLKNAGLEKFPCFDA